MFQKILLKCIFLFFLTICYTAYANKIRDLTSIQGLHENQLIGYGLVVGLDGTGDQITHIPITLHTLKNMLSQLGITMQSDMRIQPKNIAAVIVTAKLPSFIHQGQKIDVVVSSIGDAKSLKGGTLIMTPLQGIDNKVYAIAQGNIIIGDRTNSLKNIHPKFIPQLNGGIISDGAIIEKEIITNFGKETTFNLQLNQEDFTLSQYISDVINIHYPNMSTALDARTVQLHSLANNSKQVRIISNIQNIDIDLPTQDAKIIINARTGSIVMNKDVQIDACAVADKNISIVINTKQSINDSNSFVINTKKISPLTKKTEFISVTEHIKSFSKSINLNNIVKKLNFLGIQPTELISLLQAMKNAGCLHAQLEII